mgnify:CR=1 FL=1
MYTLAEKKEDLDTADGSRESPIGHPRFLTCDIVFVLYFSPNLSCHGQVFREELSISSVPILLVFCDDVSGQLFCHSNIYDKFARGL